MTLIYAFILFLLGNVVFSLKLLKSYQVPTFLGISKRKTTSVGMN